MLELELYKIRINNVKQWFIYEINRLYKGTYTFNETKLKFTFQLSWFKRLQFFIRIAKEVTNTK